MVSRSIKKVHKSLRKLQNKFLTSYDLLRLLFDVYLFFITYSQKKKKKKIQNVNKGKLHFLFLIFFSVMPT